MKRMVRLALLSALPLLWPDPAATAGESFDPKSWEARAQGISRQAAQIRAAFPAGESVRTRTLEIEVTQWKDLEELGACASSTSFGGPEKEFLGTYLLNEPVTRWSDAEPSMLRPLKFRLDLSPEKLEGAADLLSPVKTSGAGHIRRSEGPKVWNLEIVSEFEASGSVHLVSFGARLGRLDAARVGRGPLLITGAYTVVMDYKGPSFCGAKVTIKDGNATLKDATAAKEVSPPAGKKRPAAIPEPAPVPERERPGGEEAPSPAAGEDAEEAKPAKEPQVSEAPAAPGEDRKKIEEKKRTSPPEPKEGDSGAEEEAPPAEETPARPVSAAKPEEEKASALPDPRHNKGCVASGPAAGTLCLAALLGLLALRRRRLLTRPR